MEILGIIKELSLVAFWASFTVIGLSEILLLVFLHNKSAPAFSEYLKSLSFIPIIFISTCLGILSVGAIFIPGYIFHFSIQIIEYYYLIVLTASLGVLLANYKRLTTKLRYILPTNKYFYIVILFVLLIVGYNTYLAWHIGESIMYDSPIHMARINSLSNGNVTLRDPMFGYNGVYDLRYSLNVMTSLLGLGSRILQINALTIWVRSYAWFTTILALCVASMCSIFIKINSKFIKDVLPWLALALAPLLTNIHNLFLESNMPAKIVFAWQALFMIGLFIFFKTGNTGLFIAGSLLIAMTQPLTAASAIAFILLLILVTYFLNPLNRKQIFWLLLSVLILSLPVLLQSLYPSLMRSDPKAWNAIDGSYGTLEVLRRGSLAIAKPHLTFKLSQFVAFLFIPLLFITTRKAKNHFIQIFTLVTAFGILLFFYSQNLAILLGIIYMICTVKEKIIKVVIFLSGILYELIIYNPLIFDKLQQHYPLWTLVRIQSWNIYAVAAIFASLYFIVAYMGLYWRFRKPQWLIYGCGITILFVIYAVVHNGLINQHPYKLHPLKQFETRNIFQTFATKLNGRIVIVADGWPYDPSYIPAISNSYIVGGIRPEHASPMSNIIKRDRCIDIIMSKFNLSDIKASEATAIIVHTDQYPEFLIKLQESKYFSYYGTDQQWALFVLNKPILGIVNHKSQCYIPYGQ